MKKQLLLLVMLLVSHFAWGTMTSIEIIYQPILIDADGDKPTPKGFLILPIPYENFPAQPRLPYSAICQENNILRSSACNGPAWDANLLSVMGMEMYWGMDSEFVTLSLENAKEPEHVRDTDFDDIVEAAVECLRRTALGDQSRPVLKIIGKSGEEEKWKIWEEKFNRQSMVEPFTRPVEVDKKTEPQEKPKPQIFRPLRVLADCKEKIKIVPMSVLEDAEGSFFDFIAASQIEPSPYKGHGPRETNLLAERGVKIKGYLDFAILEIEFPASLLSPDTRRSRTEEASMEKWLQEETLEAAFEAVRQTGQTMGRRPRVQVRINNYSDDYGQWSAWQRQINWQSWDRPFERPKLQWLISDWKEDKL